ncbi:hypothetical protein TSUD_140760 [Trifolium subterraneum]|uniref:Uncharacterized protein n=1 Tax=Trifolium subterraneum TaxID=3900 RepID=A0A2Z6NZX1_TRISU|nr:hypothetical protein TSUD_140760 [Trifolium subterraneum]
MYKEVAKKEHNLFLLIQPQLMSKEVMLKKLNPILVIWKMLHMSLQILIPFLQILKQKKHKLKKCLVI